MRIALSIAALDKWHKAMAGTRVGINVR